MGEKFGTMSVREKEDSAEKKGITPNVGRDWKLSFPSLGGC
jgi:hypothetical protein